MRIFKVLAATVKIPGISANNMKIVYTLTLMLCGCYSFNHFPHDNWTRVRTNKLYYVFSTNTLYFDEGIEFAYSISVTFNGYAKMHEYNNDTCRKVNCPYMRYQFQNNYFSLNKDSTIQIRFTKDWHESYSVKITPSDWGKADTVYGVYWQN
jgi:hypothetical protein